MHYFRLYLVAGLGLLVAACGSSERPDGVSALTVVSGSTAFGRVQSSPEGIDCPGQCRAEFPAGTQVELVAQSTDEGRFEGWEPPCEDAAAARCGVVMHGGEQRVGIAFAAQPRRAGDQWLAGDTHVHTDHSSDGSLPRQIDQSNAGNVSVSDQIGFSQLRGMDYLVLTDHRTWDQHYNPEWDSDQLLLIPGEEANGRPHAVVHGSVERVLQQRSNDLRALQQSVWDAHAQGAVWFTAHPDRDNTESDGTPLETASAVGIAAVEMWNMARDSDANTAFIENRWNRGFRFGVVGASDNHFRELWPLAGPGRPRTEVLVHAPLEREVIAALRAGHVAVAARGLGPALRLSAEAEVDGETQHFVGGDELTLSPGTPVRVRIDVQGGATGVVRVYRNPGRDAGPVETFPVLSPGSSSFTLDFEAEESPAWIRAELRGLDLPDSPLATIEGLADDLADVDFAAIIGTVVSLPGQLRAATTPLFIAPEVVEPEPEVPLPTADDSDDGAEYLIGSRLAWTGFPDVVEQGGFTHVVAEAHVGGESRIVYRRIDGNGEAEFTRALAPGSGAARFPRLAARGETVWVVWQDERNGQLPRRPAVHARVSHDSGDSWDDEIVVRALDGRAERPVVGIDGDGNAVIAWQEIRSGRPFDIWAQVIGVDSEPSNLSGVDKAFNPPDASDTRSARWPASVQAAIAVADDGRIAVGWQDNREDPDPLFTGQAGRPSGTSPDDWNIHVALRGTGGAAWELLPPVGPSMEANRFPSLAWDASGALHAVWETQELNDSGVTSGIAAAEWNGAGWGSIARIVEDEDFSAQRPRVVRSAGGALHAAWFDARAADWRWGIAMARNDGAGWQQTGLIAAPGNNTWPALSAGNMVFASTRGARRLQRDATQQIFLSPLQP